MVSGDEVLDHFGQLYLLGQLQSVGHMADDDLGALFIAQILVRVDSARLVFGEEHRILHFADVMIQRSGTYQLAFGSDALAASARLATCMECWKVPGTVSDMRRSRLLLMLDNSTRVTLEVKPNVFSSRNSSG